MRRNSKGQYDFRPCCQSRRPEPIYDMSMAPGGLIRQSISKDIYGVDAWDIEHSSRCFIHIMNSEQYQSVTGSPPPHPPITAKDYEEKGLPWFDYYSEDPVIKGSDELMGLKSVGAKMVEETGFSLDGNASITQKNVKILKDNGVVREGDFD